MYKHYIGNRGGGKTQAMTQELMNRCNQLEKALYKACERLEFDDDCCNYKLYDSSKSKCIDDIGCARCWKEWLLKEVQDD